MLSVKWHDEAKVDLLEIMAFIAERNEQAALDLYERIERSLEHLPEHPYLYKPSLRMAGTREIVVHPNYIVFYEVTDVIEVLAVVHARENFPKP
jgi:addiction module RelE/StbE family toxin